MAEVKWTLQALDDLEAVCLFIARDAPQVAAVFADRAFAATDRLAAHPRLGRIVPEFQVETIHEISVHSYRVIYRILGDEIHVLTIHHGAHLLDSERLQE